MKIGKSRHEKPRKVIEAALHLSLLPLGLIFLELILQATASNMHGGDAVPAIVMTAFGTGLLLETVIGLIRSPKAKVIARGIVLEVFILWFLIAYFSDNSYRVFMDVSSIFKGAGDVVNEFGETLWTIVTAGFPMILLYHIPMLFYAWLLFFDKEQDVRKHVITVLICIVGLFEVILGTVLLYKDPFTNAKLTTEYNYDTAVRSVGMISSFVTDVKYQIFGNPYESIFIDDDDIIYPDEPDTSDVPDVPDEPSGEDPVPEPEPVVYGRNELPIDFESLIENAGSDTLKNVYQYLASQSGSSQNEYTGIFEGKNLILICAEAFSREVIDPELTPALYRMASKGIVFEDYYQPAWGGSTSSGEFSVLMGIIPVEQVNSVNRIIGKDLRFTLGNQLRSMGYFSAGYHDGEYTYYDRHKTHTWFGYDTWMGRGNGMEKGCPFYWPESDVDMMKYTVPMYINEDHFNIYYMTISGHANYSRSGNYMSDKNWDAVKDLDYNYTVKSYLAANMELEYAMEYLLGALEEAGKADDTVIVLTADHYPYGLEDSTAWATYGDCLADLYGYKADTNPARDHNALIIWSGCLEDMDPIVVSEPTYSLDIVPTVSNLFGFEFDSRFFVGRDVFSGEKPLVIWQDHSWMTDKGYYDGVRHTFTPKGDEEVSDAYIDSVKNKVNNKFAFSKVIHGYDLFSLVFADQ